MAFLGFILPLLFRQVGVMVREDPEALDGGEGADVGDVIDAVSRVVVNLCVRLGGY